MPFEIKMPQLGLTMEKGTVVEWLVHEGDRIEPGQDICEIETDKVSVAVEAPQSGTVTHILVHEGEEAPVGGVLAIGAELGEKLVDDLDLASLGKASSSNQKPALLSELSSYGPTGVDDAVRASWKARAIARSADLNLKVITGSGLKGRIVAEDVIKLRERLQQKRETQAVISPTSAERARAMPVAVKLSDSLGLDLSQVRGSGPNGRITQDDVIQAAAAIIRGETETRSRLATEPVQVTTTIPFAGVRKIVSERMEISARTTARVTLFREANAAALIELREKFKAHGLNVSYNDIFIRLCALSLREYPNANARMGEGQIEILDQVNIGLSVDTDRGLLVPVVHNADQLTIPQIAAETQRLVVAARNQRILPDDMGGGTFTITNLGMLGVEGFTPVINLPECCILGVGKIVRKPVVVDSKDMVMVRPMMALSLVFDHRVIDGAPAARFFDRIVQLTEDPVLLLSM